MDMLWCQGAQNIGLSSRKLKYALKCTVWSQCTPVADRPMQTDRRTNNTSCERTHRALKVFSARKRFHALTTIDLSILSPCPRAVHRDHTSTVEVRRCHTAQCIGLYTLVAVDVQAAFDAVDVIEGVPVIHFILIGSRFMLVGLWANLLLKVVSYNFISAASRVADYVLGCVCLCVCV